MEIDVADIVLNDDDNESSNNFQTVSNLAVAYDDPYDDGVLSLMKKCTELEELNLHVREHVDCEDSQVNEERLLRQVPPSIRHFRTNLINEETTSNAMKHLSMIAKLDTFGLRLESNLSFLFPLQSTLLTLVLDNACTLQDVALAHLVSQLVHLKLLSVFACRFVGLKSSKALARHPALQILHADWTDFGSRELRILAQGRVTKTLVRVTVCEAVVDCEGAEELEKAGADVDSFCRRSSQCLWMHCQGRV